MTLLGAAKLHQIAFPQAEAYQVQVARELPADVQWRAAQAEAEASRLRGRATPTQQIQTAVEIDYAHTQSRTVR